MMKRLACLALLLVLAGGALAGILFHFGESECGMAEMMGGMDCCKAALMKVETEQSAAARLCCAVNCSHDGATPPAGLNLPSQSPTAISTTHPAGMQALIIPMAVSRHVSASHGLPADSHPAYIRHLALLI